MFQEIQIKSSYLTWPKAMLIATLAMVPIHSAFAAKPQCPGPHPSCDDGGDGQFPITIPDNTAQYGGLVTEEQLGTGTPLDTNPTDLPGLPRWCIGEGINPNDGSGAYECEKGGLVTFNVSGWRNVAKNGNQGYCDLLDLNHQNSNLIYRQFTPTRFWFRNNSGCDFTQGVCDVFVKAWSFRGPETGDRHQYFFLDQFGLDDIGLLTFGGSAIIPTAQGPAGGGDGNAFADPQVWDLHTLSIKFRLAGKNKTAAICEVSWADETLRPGDASFFTTPVFP